MTDADDAKYITFKRDEFFAMLHDMGATTMVRRSELLALDDAVVIRRQDLFASPALATYASVIAIAMAMTPGDKGDLPVVADYFQRQAELAADEGWKLPTI